MLKHIVIVLVSMVSCLTGLFLYRFIPYKLHTLGYISIEESKNDMGEKTASETLMIIKGNYTANKYLNYLQLLTEVPIFGQLFMESKIAELVKVHEWELVVKEAESAIASPINRYSFAIWYYKAIGECYLNMIQYCASSSAVASYLSDSYTELYVKGLYDFQMSLTGQTSSEYNRKRSNRGRSAASDLSVL